MFILLREKWYWFLHSGVPSELHMVQDVEDLGNFVRRRLLQQSSNLAAIAASGGSPLQLIITPFTRSSGAFPAVANEKKKQSHTPAPQPSPADSSSKQTNSTENSHDQASHFSPGNSTNQKTSVDGSSGNIWKYVFVVPGVALLLIVAAVMLCMCRSRGVTTIGPWTTGLSGQLQKAFVTGDFAITHKTALLCIAMNCTSIWLVALSTTIMVLTFLWLLHDLCEPEENRMLYLTTRTRWVWPRLLSPWLKFKG